MQTTNFLIIGQGLCGTWLSYELLKAGASCIVIDETIKNSSTNIASGIINPVTGRRMAKTWMVETLLPFANHAYTEMGKALGQNLITATKVFDFFSAPDRRLEFGKRSQVFAEYLQWPENENHYHPIFNYPFGYGIVSPAYQVDVQAMKQAWRKELVAKNLLIEEKFEAENLMLENDGIIYKNIKAGKIIFCDGVAAYENPYFKSLPWAFNKGEVLIVDIPNLPKDGLYKKTNTVVPWKDGLFWIGSSYDHDFTDEKPTTAFYKQTENWLKNFLRLPHKIVDHLAGIRPGTMERRPFLGLHPVHNQVGIFNGMGSKGVSLAPYFGQQFVAHLLHQHPLLPEVNVKNFAKVLNR